MKVLYDYQAFLLQTHGGVSRSFVELVSHMPSDVHCEIAVRQSDNVYLKESGLVEGLEPLRYSRRSFMGGVDNPFKEFAFNALNYVPFVSTPKNIDRALSVNRLESGVLDVFHPTFFDGYFVKHLHGRPYVLTVHDLTVDRYDCGKKGREQISQRNRLLDGAAHIIAVSGNTRDDLVNLLGVDPSRITVIHHGAPEVDLAALGTQSPVVDERYILFVGARNVAYKNFLPFVRQVAPLLRDDGSLKVVCTGSPFSQEEFALFRSLGLEGRFLHVFASSGELYNLYHNALAFVFPSAYEGFGIPILEAYASRCPVLLNRASCFPEVAGDAALWFDMEGNGVSLGEALSGFLASGREGREKLLEKQDERLKLYGWDIAAEKLAQVYRSVASR